MKIHIIGASGSGKTTLGRDLSARLHIPHYELDKADDIQTAADVIALAEKPEWITEGIYLIWTEPLLYHADCIVLLEISWPVAAWRILRRHILNSLRGQQAYPGINGLKSLIKLLKDNRRYILNLDKVEESAVEALCAYFETHREQAAPPTEEFMTAYYEIYQSFGEPLADAFMRQCLERYKGKLHLIRNAADRERLLTFMQKGQNTMGTENRHYSRQELLAALEPGWKQYLSRLHELSEEEQLLYAQAQGFSRIQDVLVHTLAWWERSMQRSFEILGGHVVPPANDMDEFNAEVIERYQSWTREAVEEEFASVLTTFERFLKELPETACENERIQLWLRIDAIDHYDDHCLPNAPKLRVE